MICVGCGAPLTDGAIWGRIRLPKGSAERVICLGCYVNPALDLTAVLANAVAGEVGQ